MLSVSCCARFPIAKVDDRTHFLQGINTVILPRAIALDCQLNYTLSHLTSLSSSDPLYNAQFCSADSSKVVSSANIVAMISANLTGVKAEALLNDLTHNHSGGRIGNNVTIAASNLYTLHLPRDVLSAIPQTVQNAGTGSAPSYFNPLGGIIAILLLPYTCLSFVIGAALQLGTFLIDLGMKVVTSLLTTAATVVKAAVDAAVDAMKKFVDWAIAFITSVLNTILGPIIQAIKNSVTSYLSGIYSSIGQIRFEERSFGSVSSCATNNLISALNGDLFLVFYALSFVMGLVCLVLAVVTDIFGFLIAIAASLAFAMIIGQALNAGSATQPPADLDSGEIRFAALDSNISVSECQSIMSSLGVEDSNDGFGFGIIDVVVSQWVYKINFGSYLIKGGELVGKVSMAIGGIALLLSITGLLSNNNDLSRLSIVVGISGAICDFINMAYQYLIAGGKILMDALVLLLNGVSITISLMALSS